MAPSRKSQPKEYPESSIRSLDSNPAPWPQQIEKACNILQIELGSTLQDHYKTSNGSGTGGDAGDPRVDWALKWVLRSLESKSETPHERSLHRDSWQLLYELMRRSSIARIARTIRESKFVEIVHRIFEWMGEQSAAALDEEPEILRTSSMDSEISGEETKKRKRDEGAEDAVTKTNPGRGIDELFASVCAVLSYINRLINDEDGSAGYAVEHLKHATKFPPQAMADILGNALYVANALVHGMGWLSEPEAVDSSRVQKDLQASTFEPCLIPIIDTWNRSISHIGRLDPSSSHIAFHQSCSVDALLLTHTCSQWQTTGTLLERLQTLIIRHVMLPYRERQSVRKKVANVGPDASENSFVEILSKKLRRRRLTKRLPQLKYDQKTQDHKKSALLSTLFALGVESHPRHLPAQRQKEDAWLEVLFLDLVEVVRYMRKQGSFQEDKRTERRLTRYMLETCDNEKVRLETKTMEKFVKDDSGLFDESDDHCIEWDLLGHCLSLDPDIIILPQSSAKSDDAKDHKPNQYLKTLLTSLIKRLPDESHMRHSIARYVVVGLMDGYLRARDLSSFLEMWQKQIGKAIKWRKQLRKERGPHSKLYASVWEDEIVIHEASGRLGQMSTLHLNEIMTLLVGSLQNHEALESKLPALVVLDAVLQSARTEDQLNALEVIVKNVATEMLQTLKMKHSSESSGLWRCWRVLGSIQQRWQIPTGETGLNEEVQWGELTQRALELLSKLPKQHSGKDLNTASKDDSTPKDTKRIIPITAISKSLDPTPPRSLSAFDSSTVGRALETSIGNPVTNSAGLIQRKLNLAQEYYAFTFIAGQVMAAPVSSTIGHFDQAMNNILNTLQPLCEKLQYDVYGHLKYEHEERKGFIPGSSILTVEALYTGCLLSVIHEPRLFSFLDTQTQKKLLSQTSELACWVYRSEEPIEDRSKYSLTLEVPWQSLIDALPFLEDGEVQNRVIEHVCEQYVQACDLGQPDYLQDFPSTYHFALSSIRRLQPIILPQELLFTVARQACRIFLYYPHSRVDIFESHVAFIRTLTPLLNDPVRPFLQAETEGKRNSSNSVTERSFLSKIACSLRDSARDEMSIESLQLLRQIFRHVTQYLMANFTQNHELQECMKDLWADICGFGKGVPSARCSTTMMRALVAEVLDTLNSGETGASEALDINRKDLQRRRHDFMRDTLQIFPENTTIPTVVQGLKEPKGRLALCVMLDCLHFSADLLRVHPRLMTQGGYYQNFCSLLFEMIKLQDKSDSVVEPNFSSPDICPPSYIALQLAQLEMALCAGDDGLISCVLDMSEMLDEEGMSGRGVPEGSLVPSLSLRRDHERTLLSRTIYRSLSTLNWKQRGSILERIFHPKNPALDEGELQIIRAIILSDWKDVDPVAAASLSSSFTSLCEHLSTAKISEFRTILLCLQCLAAYLTRHPRSVNFHHVTIALSTITYLSQQLPKPITTLRSAHLYTALVRLTSILLRSFRPQVARYHHILLLTLQSLLHNLFVPYTSNASSPPSITSLTVTHAAAYARLLTLLCDPTPSSVAPPSRKSQQQHKGLVNQTRQAKSITGEHMQYLIASYCRYQLDGRLEAAMKAILAPALWVTLDVIEQSTLRAMGESMDDAGRGVFRALYGEYSRFKEGRNR